MLPAVVRLVDGRNCSGKALSSRIDLPDEPVRPTGGDKIKRQRRPLRGNEHAILVQRTHPRQCHPQRIALIRLLHFKSTDEDRFGRCG